MRAQRWTAWCAEPWGAATPRSRARAVLATGCPGSDLGSVKQEATTGVVGADTVSCVIPVPAPDITYDVTINKSRIATRTSMKYGLDTMAAWQQVG